jgi:alpha-tubulin suppressor-like RCC1 family protein
LLCRHCSGLGSIALGSYHTCVIVASGGVKCWGNNGNGQLGIGDTSTRYSPADVGLGAGMVF